MKSVSGISANSLIYSLTVLKGSSMNMFSMCMFFMCMMQRAFFNMLSSEKTVN